MSEKKERAALPAETAEMLMAEAEKAREWVMERGISDGERPLDKVTREELWVMLYRMEGDTNDKLAGTLRE